ncbi:hypothetical protein LINGRAHAP2_LOCUS7191 [Linum grandiflorum]
MFCYWSLDKYSKLTWKYFELAISYVILKSLQSLDVDVVKGAIISKNSKRLVGDTKLGEVFYEIFVEVPMKTNEPLVRPYESFQTIGDAAKQTIAWTSFFVSEVFIVRKILKMSSMVLIEF